MAEISRESFITGGGNPLDESIAVWKLPYAVSTARFWLLPTELTKPRGLGWVLPHAIQIRLCLINAIPRDRGNYGMLSGCRFFFHASSLRDILFFFPFISLSFFLSSRIDAKRDGEFIGIDIGNDKLPSLIRDFCD